MLKKSLEFALVPHINKAVNQAKLDIWAALNDRFELLERSLEDKVADFTRQHQWLVDFQDYTKTKKKNFMHQVSNASNDDSKYSNNCPKSVAKVSNFMDSSKASASRSDFRIVSAGTQQNQKIKVSSKKQTSINEVPKNERTIKNPFLSNSSKLDETPVEQQEATVFGESKVSEKSKGKVYVKRSALQKLQASPNIEAETPEFLFDSLQWIANKTDILQSQVVQEKERVEFYVKKINEKFKSTDFILKDILNSQSVMKGDEQGENSKFESLLNETILDYGPDGKVRFEDLIDVPSNYDMEDDEEPEQEDSSVQKIDMNTLKEENLEHQDESQEQSESLLGQVQNSKEKKDDTFELSVDHKSKPIAPVKVVFFKKD